MNLQCMPADYLNLLWLWTHACTYNTHALTTIFTCIYSSHVTACSRPSNLIANTGLTTLLLLWPHVHTQTSTSERIYCITFIYCIHFGQCYQWSSVSAHNVTIAVCVAVTNYYWMPSMMDPFLQFQLKLTRELTVCCWQWHEWVGGSL